MFTKIRRSIAVATIAAFFFTSLMPAGAYAQISSFQNLPWMPQPGVRVSLSPEFEPSHLVGITIHPDNALQFDFLIQKGNKKLDPSQKQIEYKKLIKYFLASLTVPDDEQWVNLSPYEKNRIISGDFGKTEMGRDLLAQDYILKQITASLIYPEESLGKKFWDTIYERARQEYGTTDIPVNTFNKVWIVPDEALVYESGNTAYILKSHLKVMMEEDYLSLNKHTGLTNPSTKTHTLASKVVKEIILPQLQIEVNEGKNFAPLRQMYSGMVLAAWYKKSLRESLLGKVYADRSKVKGVDQDPKTNELIYQRYLRAFKKGVFNFIKDDIDLYTKQTIPRKYFSGGFVNQAMRVMENIHGTADLAQLPLNERTEVAIAARSVDPSQIDYAMTDLNTYKFEGPGVIMNAIELNKQAEKGLPISNEVLLQQAEMLTSSFEYINGEVRRKFIAALASGNASSKYELQVREDWKNLSKGLNDSYQKLDFALDLFRALLSKKVVGDTSEKDAKARKMYAEQLQLTLKGLMPLLKNNRQYKALIHLITNLRLLQKRAARPLTEEKTNNGTTSQAMNSWTRGLMNLLSGAILLSAVSCGVINPGVTDTRYRDFFNFPPTYSIEAKGPVYFMGQAHLKEDSLLTLRDQMRSVDPQQGRVYVDSYLNQNEDALKNYQDQVPEIRALLLKNGHVHFILEGSPKIIRSSIAELPKAYKDAQELMVRMDYHDPRIRADRYFLLMENPVRYLLYKEPSLFRHATIESFDITSLLLAGLNKVNEANEASKDMVSKLQEKGVKDQDINNISLLFQDVRKDTLSDEQLRKLLLPYTNDEEVFRLTKNFMLLTREAINFASIRSQIIAYGIHRYQKPGEVYFETIGGFHVIDISDGKGGQILSIAHELEKMNAAPTTLPVLWHGMEKQAVLDALNQKSFLGQFSMPQLESSMKEGEQYQALVTAAKEALVQLKIFSAKDLDGVNFLFIKGLNESDLLKLHQHLTLENQRIIIVNADAFGPMNVEGQFNAIMRRMTEDGQHIKDYHENPQMPSLEDAAKEYKAWTDVLDKTNNTQIDPESGQEWSQTTKISDSFNYLLEKNDRVKPGSYIAQVQSDINDWKYTSIGFEEDNLGRFITIRLSNSKTGQILRTFNDGVETTIMPVTGKEKITPYDEHLVETMVEQGEASKSPAMAVEGINNNRRVEPLVGANPTRPGLDQKSPDLGKKGTARGKGFEGQLQEAKNKLKPAAQQAPVSSNEKQLNDLRLEKDRLVVSLGTLKSPALESQRKAATERLAVINERLKSLGGDSAMLNGGIDLNAANLDLEIKRDGRGVPLPWSKQDMAQLSRIEGFVPVIIDIKPVSELPLLNELQQKLQSLSVS